MKNKKRNIVLSLLLLVVLLSVVFSVVFNFSMLNYIDKEARKTLLIEAQLNESDEISDDSLFDKQTFSATALYIDSRFLLDRQNYTTDAEFEKENYLLRQCRMNKEQLLKGEILLLNVQKERYYVMQIPVGEDIFDCDLAILYVNTAPFQRLIGKINWIFGEVILISAVLVAFLGFYAGKQLDDSDRKMKQFFQNVSHELKTPIMSIQGYAEGIEQGLIQDTEKAARVILSESDRMTGMVNEILELSKLESGTIQANFTQTDVSQVLYECLERLEPLAKKEGIFFDVDVEDSVVLSCDSDLIEKVFLNILTNALRYANETIEISLHTVKNMVKISILDDGNGLTEEDAKHIFERFYRGKKGCSGVGLALAKEITEFHKGKIYLKVQPKTCFVVELPKK